MTTRYTKDHEWVRMDGDIAVIGITNHAAGQLGDVVFVELPAVGKNFSAHADMAVVESVKAASDVYAPIGGAIVEINQAIVDDPARVNADPESGSWFVKMKPSNKAEFDALMDAAAYKKLTQ